MVLFDYMRGFSCIIMDVIREQGKEKGDKAVKDWKRWGKKKRCIDDDGVENWMLKWKVGGMEETHGKIHME